MSVPGIAPVRVHVDPIAERSAFDLGADGYTVGRDVVLARGKSDDQRLLAHELSHVIQQRRQPAALQRQESANVPTLDQLYENSVEQARQTGDWRRAAELLNAFNHEDIQYRLSQLSTGEVSQLHQGAVDNKAVGPDSNAAVLTAADVPRASTAPPNASTAPPVQNNARSESQPTSQLDVANMAAYDKLELAYKRASLAPAIRQRFADLVTPQALVGAIVGFAVAFAVSQLTPVGWAADIGIFFTGVFLGSALFSTIRHLIAFADARNATTVDELDAAGNEFAAAVAEISVDAVILLVTHAVPGGANSGGTSPPSTQLSLRMGIRSDGSFVPVLAETVPAGIPVMTSVQAGVKGAAAVPALMAAMSGGPSPPSSGSSSGQGSGGASSSGGPEGKAPLANATDAELDAAVEGMTGDGDMIELGPHRAAKANRNALGVTGKQVQSGHLMPQAVGKKLPGYNAQDALTRLLNTADHAGIDSYWKKAFTAMRQSGQTTAPAWDVFETIAESIWRGPASVSEGEKLSLIGRLKDEMFMEIGLDPGEMIDLPYPNIGPP